MNKYLLFLGLIFFSSCCFSANIYGHIEEGNLNKVKKIIEKKLPYTAYVLEEQNGVEFELNIYSYAAAKNQEEILLYLIDNHQEISRSTEWMSEAIGPAISTLGSFEAVKQMVEAGADVNTYCQLCLHTPPIAIALAYDHLDIYNFLKEQNANLINPGARYDVIHAAAGYSDFSVFLDLIENDHLDPHQQDAEGANSFFYAFTVEDNRIDYFLDQGFNVNEQDDLGYSLLMAASSAGNTQAIEILLNHNANLFATDQEGFNAFDYANNLKTVQFFCYYIGANIKSGEECGALPYINSIIELDDPAIFNFYISFMGEKQCFDKYPLKNGEYPYHAILYIENDRIAIFNTLVSLGYKDHYVATKETQKSAYDYAISYGDNELIQLFRKEY